MSGIKLHCSITELAAMLEVSTDTIRDWRKNKKGRKYERCPGPDGQVWNALHVVRWIKCRSPRFRSRHRAMEIEPLLEQLDAVALEKKTQKTLKESEPEKPLLEAVDDDEVDLEVGDKGFEGAMEALRDVEFFFRKNMTKTLKSLDFRNANEVKTFVSAFNEWKDIIIELRSGEKELLKLLKDQKKVLSMDEFQTWIMKHFGRVKVNLAQLPKDISTHLVGLDAVQIELKLGDRIYEILDSVKDFPDGSVVENRLESAE